MAKGKNHYRRGRRSRKRGFGAWSLGKKIGVILGGTVALVAATGAVILASKLSKIEKVPIDPMELSVSEEARAQESALQTSFPGLLRDQCKGQELGDLLASAACLTSRGV